MPRLTDTQRSIVDRIANGERLVGPVTRFDRRPSRCWQRPWGFGNGRPVDANAVKGLIARGIVETRPAEDAEREAVLRETDAR